MNYAVSDLLYLVEQVNSRLQSNKARVKTYPNIRADEFTGADVVNNWLKEFVDPFACFYCGCNLMGTPWVLEHGQSMSKGGSHSPRNLFPSCRSCNSRKSDKDFWGFIGQKKGFEFKQRLMVAAAKDRFGGESGIFSLKQMFAETRHKAYEIQESLK